MTLFREMLIKIRENESTKLAIKSIETLIRDLEKSPFWVDSLIESKLKDVIKFSDMSDFLYEYEHGKLTGMVLVAEESVLNWFRYQRIQKDLQIIRTNLKGE